MEAIIEAGKIICLFIGVLFTYVNSAKVVLREEVPMGNLVAQSISITGFFYLQWLIK
jgi:hypothetical protein